MLCSRSFHKSRVLCVLACSNFHGLCIHCDPKFQFVPGLLGCVYIGFQFILGSMVCVLYIFLYYVCFNSEVFIVFMSMFIVFMSMSAFMVLYVHIAFYFSILILLGLVGCYFISTISQSRPRIRYNYDVARQLIQ